MAHNPSATPTLDRPFTLITGDWDALENDAKKVRFPVFVEEQHVPAEIELDEFDPLSVHVVAYCEGQPIGTGRLLPDGHIGRMAVLPAYRGSGVGSLLLNELIEQAKVRDYPVLELSAQCHAQGFYERHGFSAYGDVYLDAGIDHIAMRRELHE